jgi:hypothetical protein
MLPLLDGTNSPRLAPLVSFSSELWLPLLRKGGQPLQPILSGDDLQSIADGEERREASPSGWQPGGIRRAHRRQQRQRRCTGELRMCRRYAEVHPIDPPTHPPTCA